MRTGIILVAFALLLITGISAIDAAAQNSGEHTDIDGESWAPNAGTFTELDDSRIDGAVYSDNVTVRNESGARMEPGSDYEWDRNNGTVKALSGGNLDGTGQNASISYSYSIPSQFATDMADTFGFALNASTALLIVMVAVLCIAGMRVLGDV